MTSVGDLGSVPFVQVMFALVENYTSSRSAQCVFHCHGTSRREAKGRMALLCAAVQTALLDKMLGLLPKLRKAFI